jgi:hypothetical protein
LSKSYPPSNRATSRALRSFRFVEKKDISKLYILTAVVGFFFFFRGDNRDTSTTHTHTHTRREPVASVGSSRDPPSSGMELCVSVKRQTKELQDEVGGGFIGCAEL